MARVAPAACSFWAMPQAMERLLASPNTTAVLPARLIMLSFFLHGPCSGLVRLLRGMPDQPIHRISANISRRASSAQIDQLDLAGRAAQEAGAEALEFVDGVGSEAANLELRARVHRGRVLRGRRTFFRA